jgi:hypothetical protein
VPDVQILLTLASSYQVREMWMTDDRSYAFEIREDYQWFPGLAVPDMNISRKRKFGGV